MTTNESPKNDRIQILYIYDPLCGWCYGFGPVIHQLEQNYSAKADFRIVSGGMVLGDRVQPIGKMADYILNAIPRLEQMTGVKMGEAYKSILREGTQVFSSEKPSLALEAFKSIDSAKAIEFAHDVQTELFLNGNSMEKDSTYLPLLRKYGIDEKLFFERLVSENIRNKTYSGFEFSNQLGVSGFPCVIGLKNDQYYLLSSGYQDFKTLSGTVERFLQ